MLNFERINYDLVYGKNILQKVYQFTALKMQNIGAFRGQVKI